MGWASGFSAGTQMAKSALDAYQQAQRQAAMAEAAKQYQVTEGAYGQGLQGNIEQVQGLKQQAIAGGMTPEMAAQQYDPAIAELTRRAGLTSADYSIASSPENFGSRTAALQAAAPLRMEAQAQALEGLGYAEDANKLRAQGMQAQKSRLELAGLQRTEDTAKAVQAANEEAAKFAKKLMGTGDAQRALTLEDNLAIQQRRISSLNAAGQTQAAADAMNNYYTLAEKQFKANERTLQQDWNQTMASGNLDAYGKFYDKYVLDGAKVTSVTQDKDGKIKVNRVTDDGQPLPPVTIGSFDELKSTLESFTNPKALKEWSQREFQNNMETAKFTEIKRSNRANEGLRGRTATEQERSNRAQENLGQQRVDVARQTEARQNWEGTEAVRQRDEALGLQAGELGVKKLNAVQERAVNQARTEYYQAQAAASKAKGTITPQKVADIRAKLVAAGIQGQELEDTMADITGQPTATQMLIDRMAAGMAAQGGLQ